ncbi:MAG TPA: DUF362 domain-containing protein [Candidatus Lokiarchaeia archaeon]|nr:DUF362 domain-containing protein [Candidatus Lokiarchaeia archaeon]
MFRSKLVLLTMISIVSLALPRSSEAAKEAMGKLLDTLGYRPSQPRVFIKPNIVDSLPPTDPVDTDPSIVGGFVLALADRGTSEFVIGEGTGYFNDEKNWERLLEESGYKAMVADLVNNHGINVSTLNLETAERDDFPWTFGTLRLPLLCKTHAYINMAKMKTHMHTMVTLATKNQKGLLLLADKKAFHLGKKYGTLHENIKALGNAVQPELSIIDATRALEGSGPTIAANETSTRRLKLCIGGTSMAETDNAACKIMGIDVSEVQHLDKVEFEIAQGSEPLLPADPPFARPKIEIKMTEHFYRHVFESACTGCQIAMSRMFRKLVLVPELQKAFGTFQTEHGRIDLVLGTTSKEKLDEIASKGGQLVFFGNCTKKFAEKFEGSIHIAGCSPDHNDAIRILLGDTG